VNVGNEGLNERKKRRRRQKDATVVDERTVHLKIGLRNDKKQPEDS